MKNKVFPRKTHRNVRFPNENLQYARKIRFSLGKPKENVRNKVWPNLSKKKVRPNLSKKKPATGFEGFKFSGFGAYGLGIFGFRGFRVSGV